MKYLPSIILEVGFFFPRKVLSITWGSAHYFVWWGTIAGEGFFYTWKRLYSVCCYESFVILALSRKWQPCCCPWAVSEYLHASCARHELRICWAAPDKMELVCSILGMCALPFALEVLQIWVDLGYAFSKRKHDVSHVSATSLAPAIAPECHDFLS